MVDAAAVGGSIKGMIITYILVIAGWQAASVGSSLLCSVVNEKFSFGIRKQVYDKILRSVWSDISKYKGGDVITRLTTDTANIASGIVNVIPSIFTYGFQLIATFITLYIYSKELALFTIILAPVAVLVAWILGRRMKRLEDRVLKSESDYRSFMHESIGNIPIIKSFEDEDYSSGQFAKLRKERFYWVFKKSKFNMAASLVLNSAFQIAYIVAFVFGTVGISNGTVTFGTMTVFLTLVTKIQEPISQLAECVPAAVSVFASAGRVMDIQQIEDEKKRSCRILEIP